MALTAQLFEKIHGCKDGYRRSAYRNRGYQYIFCREHPYVNSDGKVLEHRFLMEKKIGRFLKPEEECHHLNHVRADNHPENLVLLASKTEHMRRYHSKQFDPALIETVRKAAKNYSVSRNMIAEQTGISVSTVKNICRKHEIKWIGSDEHELDEPTVQELLKTRTMKQVAEHFGCSIGTMRRRFSHLAREHKPTYYLDPYKDQILEMRRNGMTYRAIGSRFGVRIKTVLDSIARWNRPEDFGALNRKKLLFLDEFQEEIFQLLSIGVPMTKIAAKFETSRTSLNAAILRWSAQDAMPPEVADRLNSNANRTMKVQSRASHNETPLECDAVHQAFGSHLQP